MEPLDCSNISRRVWLVKVPKYVSNCWAKATPNEELGKIRIGSRDNGKAFVMFSLSETIANHTKQSNEHSKQNELIPSEHQFLLSEVRDQTLAVFSETHKTNLTVEGIVGQKVDCRPLETDDYLCLKKESIEKAEIPLRVTKRLNKAIVSFKPIANRDLDEQVMKKSASSKKYRIDKETVKDMIFEAFGSQRYYRYKELAEIIQQPEKYLRDILKELCDFGLKGDHKHLYCLKKEYSHYNKHNK